MDLRNSVKLVILPILLLSMFCSDTNGQLARFNAGFVGGLNFSELEGKSVTDYFGLNAGLIGTARLSKHSQLGLEMLFSQNGEYVLPEYYPAIQYGPVWLNHVEVPVHIDWLIGVFERDEYYDWNLNIGLAYARLVGYNIENVEKENVDQQVIYRNRDAVLLQAGTTYHFTKKMGVNFKASLPLRIDGLSWTLAARVIYMLN